MQISRLRIPRIRFFPIFYSGTFTLFAFLLFALLLVSPGDHIYQSMKAGELYRIIVVGGVYVLTFVIALFIYAARLFSTRSALANIPREWDLSGNEVENPSLGLGLSSKMGRLVREGWEKSAVVTYESTPRALKGGSQVVHAVTKAEGGHRGSVRGMTEPLWGTIRHPGWSDPECKDLPNLHFASVVAELPSLLEAKAVSLRPHAHSHEDMDGDDSSVDSAVFELLRRPAHMDLSGYIKHLSSLGILDANPVQHQAFLEIYEKARFSGIPLEEDEFRHLMKFFSDLLREVEDTDESLVAALVMDSSTAHESRRSSNDSGGTTRHYKSHPQSSSDSMTSRSEAQATTYTAPSRFRYSREISDFTGPSTSGSDMTREETMETRSQLGSIYADSVSLASSAGSVIRAGPPPAQLNIPLVHHDEHD